MALPPDLERADILRLAEHFDEAKAAARSYLGRHADDPDAWNVLGMICTDARELEDAVSHIERAMRLRDSPRYRRNLAIALLYQGNWVAGWRY